MLSQQALAVHERALRGKQMQREEASALWIKGPMAFYGLKMIKNWY